MKPEENAPNDSLSWPDLAPKSVLEQAFIEEYLKSRGTTMEGLKKLPPEEARHLMEEACRFASVKLTEIEARAGYRHKVGE